MKADVGNYNANLAAASRTLKNFREENLSLGGVVKNMTRSFTGYAAGLMSIGAVAGKLHDTVTEAVQLAKSAEGVRLAFNRLNDPGILDGLRKATHGTVTDVELMKSAVKFNDFKLPLEELGTMLAFAQQKAKDTGQSVDFMVDSIVTGLGRKSLMILDNLGLSANEVKEKMKDTGDMTKAVGEIIREQMAKAGDYVETAADRAAQANVSLQNKMEELGRKFAPLEEASNSLWTSMKIGILNVIGGPLTKLLSGLTEAGRMMNAYNNIGGNGKVGRMISNLAGASEQDRPGLYQRQQEEIWRYINRRENALKDRDRWFKDMGNKELGEHLSREYKAFGTSDRGEIQAQIDAAKKVLSDYQQAAKPLLSPVKPVVDTSGAEQSITSLTKKLKDTHEQREIVKGSLNDLDNQIKELRDAQSNVTNVTEWQKFQDKIDAVKNRIKELKGELSNIEAGNMVSLGKIKGLSITDMVPVPTGSDMIKRGDQRIKDFKISGGEDLAKQGEQAQKAWNLAAQAVSSVGDAFNSIEDPGVKAMGTVTQAIASIALGFAQASVTASSMGPWGWVAFLAAGMAAMATTISTVHSLTGFANGGIVDGRNGGFVGGTNFSGDNIGNVRLNAGELVLNQAQAGVIANALQDRDFAFGASLQPWVDGEKIFLGMNNTSKRMGRGEIVTTSTLQRLGLI